MTNETSKPESDDDIRIYVFDPQGWEARVKQTWEKEYCYFKAPGEDHFHLLMANEVYLVRGNEKYCLRCALRRGMITRDRLYWQHAPKTLGES